VISRKTKSLTVAIGAAAAMLVSMGNASAYTSGQWQTTSHNCFAELNLNGAGYGYVAAFLTSNTGTCGFSFQERMEPSGATSVLASTTLYDNQGEWQPSASYNSPNQLRVCAHSQVTGVTACTPWID
jgi:hypothetical protein